MLILRALLADLFSFGGDSHLGPEEGANCA